MLAPYRVLDLTDESGFLCGKILADLGADVIKVEPPEGDAARLIEPSPSGRHDRATHLFWLSHNTNKRGITLKLEVPQGRKLYKKLVSSADFVIESHPPGRLDELGLGFETLRAINPRLVMISITPFGQTGPYRDYKGGDLVAMAMSGMMSLIGNPDGAPLRVSLPQSPLWAGMYGAAGGLIAHYHREVSGLGQQVDISLQSGLLWALANAPSFWATNRTIPKRDGRQLTGRSVIGATMQAIYRCKDGYINFIVYGGAAGQRSNQALVQWMDQEGLAVDHLVRKDWSCFDIQKTTQEEIDEIERPAAELFLRCTKAQFLEQAFGRGILGYPVADARDILTDPHLEGRQFWKVIPCPTLDRSIKFPGEFARFSEVTPGPIRPAPTIGQHNQEIYQDELGLSDTELEELKAREVI